MSWPRTGYKGARAITNKPVKSREVNRQQYRGVGAPLAYRKRRLNKKSAAEIYRERSKREVEQKSEYLSADAKERILSDNLDLRSRKLK